ncbi:hypothetical protein [Propionivibrio dicarboxylicus]|uniref:Uncharacterized protein n=1 Tax=Propionivibrio dicarboxylicus TaxID=83767 RepID=A0A1G8N4F0_9RHOO|nr:hypothetical protein [Propionivibrio dicarboxylicus]SDI75023.1 hypothetical protein SAMN05660652_03976 [Propionivibrio dicarboxylicus]
MTRNVWPSLASIARQLHASDDVIDDTPFVELLPFDDIDLPPHIAALIEQRVASQQRPQGNALQPGQLVSVPPSAFPPDRRPAVPVLLALDREDYRHGTWHAWVVAGEADYAGWHDLVVPAEEGLDPAAAMIQAWNAIELRIPVEAIPMGRLSIESLSAARLLAADAVERCPATASPRPGHIALRPVGDHCWALTGTPVAAKDPRTVYRAMYRKMITALSREAQSARQQPLLAGLVASIERFVHELGKSLEPVRWLPDAMGDESEMRAWRIDELFEVALLPVADKAVELRVRLLRNDTAMIALYQQDLLLETEKLSGPEDEAALTLTDDETMAVTIAIGYHAPLIWHIRRR